MDYIAAVLVHHKATLGVPDARAVNYGQAHYAHDSKNHQHTDRHPGVTAL